MIAQLLFLVSAAVYMTGFALMWFLDKAKLGTILGFAGIAGIAAAVWLR